MFYGTARGFGGRGGGVGFGFRGSSPPYPYIGRGRGGLPRCRYPNSALPFHDAPVLTYAAQITHEQELDFLKGQAGEIKKELDRVESRIRDLEANKKE
jgi:hypothetical protein